MRNVMLWRGNRHAPGSLKRTPSDDLMTRMNTSFLKRHTAWIVLTGDGLALLAFVAVGQRDHALVEAANPLGRLMLVTACFVFPWVVAGWRLGAFPAGDRVTARALFAHGLNTWLVAAPLGMLLRAFALGSVVIARAFILVGLGFGGLFLLAWRLIFWWLWRKAAKL